MAIIKNNKKVIGIYKGQSPIKKANRGSTTFWSSETPYDIDIEFARANETGNVFDINGTKISTTDAYYKGRLKDLGFDEIESFSFNTSLLTKINAFPSVANVKTLSRVYDNCTQLTEIPDLDYPNDVDCNQMFASTSISALANIFPATAQGMYSACPNLTEVDVSDYLNYASDVSIFIAGCSNLTKFTFDGYNTIAPSNLFNFFYGDAKLSVINHIRKVKLDNATNISGMFYGCSNLTDIANINFGSKPTSLLTNASDLFNGSGLDLTTVDSTNYPLLYNFFTNCTNLTNVSGLFANSQLGKDGWANYDDEYGLRIFNGGSIENCSRLFQNTPIRYINLGYSDLSTVTNCSEMFSGCYNLERVTFAGAINLREDVNYSGMFQGCSNLNEIQFDNIPSCESVNILKAALEEAGLTSQVTFNFSSGEPDCGDGNSNPYDIKVTHEIPSSGEYTLRNTDGGDDTWDKYLFTTPKYNIAIGLEDTMYVNDELVTFSETYTFNDAGTYEIGYNYNTNGAYTINPDKSFKSISTITKIEFGADTTEIIAAGEFKQGTSNGYNCYVTGTCANCTSLTEIVFPDTLEKIEGPVFLGCTSLRSVTIPESVRYIWNSSGNTSGYGVFMKDTNLMEVKVLGDIGQIELGANCIPDSNAGTVYYKSGTTPHESWYQYLPSWVFMEFDDNVIDAGGEV